MIRKSKKDSSQQKAWLEWLGEDASVYSDQKSVATPVSSRVQAGVDGIASRYRVPSDSRQRTRASVTSVDHPTEDDSHTRVTAPADTKSDNISINIHLPKIHFPRPQIVRDQLYRLRWWAAAAIAVLLLLFGGKFLLSYKQAAISDRKRQNQGAESQKPNFDPIKPTTTKSDKSKVDSSVAYDPKRQLYKFNDTYEDADIVVSEQVLPEVVRKNPETIKKAAAAIGATDSFQTSFGTVYVATAEKGGAQRLVFVYQKLLVFVSSDITLSNLTWSQYIISLQ